MHICKHLAALHRKILFLIAIYFSNFTISVHYHQLSHSFFLPFTLCCFCNFKQVEHRRKKIKAGGGEFGKLLPGY